jgi:hypothetical protein
VAGLCRPPGGGGAPATSHSPLCIIHRLIHRLMHMGGPVRESGQRHRANPACPRWGVTEPPCRNQNIPPASSPACSPNRTCPRLGVPLNSVIVIPGPAAIKPGNTGPQNTPLLTVAPCRSGSVQHHGEPMISNESTDERVCVSRELPDLVRLLRGTVRQDLSAGN